MGWLDKLSELIKIDVSAHFDFRNCLNIQIGNNSSQTDKYNCTDGNNLLINTARFNAAEMASLKEITKEIFEESESILEADSRTRIDRYRVVSSSAQYIRDFDYFKDKIPCTDLRMLKACLYTTMCFDLDNNDGERSKQQIIAMFGERGRNLCNLCSAGYLEAWFRPLWEELIKTYPDHIAKDKFQTFYLRVLKEMPYTVFVAKTLSEGEVMEQVSRKFSALLSYSILWINIHGIGTANIDKIQKVIKILRKLMPELQQTIEQENNKIYVRLEMSKTEPQKLLQYSNILSNPIAIPETITSQDPGK